MKHLSDVEILPITKLLEMETSAMAISDEQLNALTQTGIQATGARITGLQNFISDNIFPSICS